MDEAVYDDFNIGQLNKSCRDHAIDSYGLFLVFYSSDIAPIGFEDIIIDNRTKLQRKLDEEEEALDRGDIDVWGVMVEDSVF